MASMSFTHLATLRLTLYFLAFIAGPAHSEISKLDDTTDDSKRDTSTHHELKKRSFLSTGLNTTRQPFGIVSWKEGFQVKSCEGVLIGPTNVLTVVQCTPNKNLLVTNFQFTISGFTASVRDAYRTTGNNFIILHLNRRLVGISYAVLSWFGEDQADASYNTKQELITGNHYYLSDASGRLPLLRSCFFVDDRDDLIVLSCPYSGKELSRQLGEAFYRRYLQTSDYIVIGLIRDETRDERRLIEARRLSETDISDIMSVAKSLGSGPPQDTNSIPHGSIIATFNVQGFSAQHRDLGEDVVSTLIDLFSNASIVAVQETASIQHYPLLKKRLNSSGLTFVPESGKSHGLAYVFKRGTVAASHCRHIIDKFLLTYACNFQLEREALTIYNVHLKAGDSTTNVNKRRSQIESLKKFMSNDDRREEVFIVAGDMNTKNRAELEDVIRRFPSVRHHEPGVSTPAGRHYDRILVNDNLRLTHIFPFIPRTANRSEIEDLHHSFFPNLENGRPNPKHRNFELSDHLPLYYDDPVTKIRFGTWNVQKKLDSSSSLDDIYTKIFSVYDVIALQELSVNSELGDLTRNPKHLNRRWKVSNVLNRERLAFAYNENKFKSPTCGELSISPRRRRNRNMNERDVYWCKFEEKLTKKILILANVHILNPGLISIGHKYRREVYDYFQSSMNSNTMIYLLGDFNMNVPAKSRNKVCRHLVSHHADWTFTMVDSKHVRDYIWDARTSYPGIVNCKVINPELSKFDNNYLINNEKANASPMKSFARWKEISDHYPIFMRFKGWQTKSVGRYRIPLRIASLEE